MDKYVVAVFSARVLNRGGKLIHVEIAPLAIPKAVVEGDDVTPSPA
jgi:hypothetical protein